MKQKRLLKAMVGGLLLATMAPLAASAASIEISIARFPDANFREYVKTFDTNNDDYLSDSERAAVTEINVDNKNIKSMRGLQYFTNLTKLSCSNNQIGDLNFSKNTNIRVIWCANNRISGTALRKMIESLPNRTSQTENGSIYFRYQNEGEYKGANTLSFPYTKMKTKGWKAYEYGAKNWLEIAANAYETAYLNATMFPDDNFRNYLISKLGIAQGGAISEAKIDALTELDVSGKGIKSLKGVEKLTGLKRLECYDNELTSLDLSYNAYLGIVVCYENRIFGTEMDKLVESLPGLDIYVEQNDNTVHGGWIYLCGNSNVEGNTYTKDHTTVCYAKCWFPGYFSGGGTLTESPLYINSKTFPDDAFRSFIRSQSYGEDGKITATEIANITSLSTSNSSVASVAGIEYFSELKDLTLLGQPEMTALNITRNTKLEKLACQNNKVATIDLSNNTMLKELNVIGTQVSSIDFTPFKNTLESFKCTNSKMRNFSFLSSLTNLTALYCGGCELSSLDVSGNTKLKQLSCSNNNLQSLNLSNNTNLVTLYCNGNQLTGLNLSKNTALTYLSCTNNKLTSLTLPYSTNLKNIYIYENQLGLDAMEAIYNTLNTARNTGARVCLYNDALGREGNAFSHSLQVYFTNNISAELTHVRSGEQFYDLANRLVPKDIPTCFAGSQVILPIDLQRSTDKLVVGFTFDLVLPDGIILTKAETVTNMLSNHTVSYTKDATYPGVYHVTVDSESASVAGYNGTALNLTLNVMKAMEENIRLQNAVLKVKGGINHSSTTSTSDYVVGPLTTTISSVNINDPGDVNSSGDVTPADAIMVLYHYFGVEQVINIDVADMNDDGYITPADAIQVLYHYFGANGSRATKPATTTATEDMDPE